LVIFLRRYNRGLVRRQMSNSEAKQVRGAHVSAAAVAIAAAAAAAAANHNSVDEKPEQNYSPSHHQHFTFVCLSHSFDTAPL
jgi:hypothetical protein